MHYRWAVVAGVAGALGGWAASGINNPTPVTLLNCARDGGMCIVVARFPDNEHCESFRAEYDMVCDRTETSVQCKKPERDIYARTRCQW